jgi:hypothetical protein
MKVVSPDFYLLPFYFFLICDTISAFPNLNGNLLFCAPLG